VEVAAYYVVSEALTNMTKHAEASQAQVRVEQHDSTLRLCVGDDGVGGAEPQRGSGLLGLRDRVEALGGSIDVTSPVGHGTVIQVSLPIERTDGACPPESP
jgi:signal transduction histidine kinase